MTAIEYAEKQFAESKVAQNLYKRPELIPEVFKQWYINTVSLAYATGIRDGLLQISTNRIKEATNRIEKVIIHDNKE